MQVKDLADHLLRGADEVDSLPDDFVVGEFGERFERAVCVNGVTLRAQLGFFFFSSRRRHTRLQSDWSSDVCSSDLTPPPIAPADIICVSITKGNTSAMPAS